MRIYQLIENDTVAFEGSLFQCFKEIENREVDNLSDPRIVITTVIQLKKAALQHKWLNGEKTGGDVPFGYCLDIQGPIFIEDSREQAVINLIKVLQEDGCSLTYICRKVETKGYLTKSGGTKSHS